MWRRGSRPRALTFLVRIRKGKVPRPHGDCLVVLTDDCMIVPMSGSQEALIRQVRDLEELLGGEYAWVRLLYSRLLPYNPSPPPPSAPFSSP